MAMSARETVVRSLKLRRPLRLEKQEKEALQLVIYRSYTITYTLTECTNVVDEQLNLIRPVAWT